MITDYYLDESGNTGDLCKVGAHPTFGGQRMFVLACIGIPSVNELAEEVERLKRLHRLQGEELKSTNTKSKPRFVSDLACFLAKKEWPVFIELVDKHYFIVANIIERVVVPYLHEGDLSADSRFMKTTMADYMALHAPDELAQLYAIACQSRKRPDARKVYSAILKWARKSQASREVAGGIELFTRDSLKDFEKLHPLKAVERALPIPDRSKKEGNVWLLPNVSSFTNIYARLNRHLRGNIEKVSFIHDEQVHFDAIIGSNKVVAEQLSHEGILLNLPSADYNFRATAALNFLNSKSSVGIQVADVIAGFVSRYVYQKIWETASMSADHDQAYDHIQALCGRYEVTGLNFVAPAALVEHLNRLRSGRN